VSIDLALLHAPSIYDFRCKTVRYGPISDLIPSSPIFEMYPIGFASIAEYLERNGHKVHIANLATLMINDDDFNAEELIMEGFSATYFYRELFSIEPEACWNSGR